MPRAIPRSPGRLQAPSPGRRQERAAGRGQRGRAWRSRAGGGSSPPRRPDSAARPRSDTGPARPCRRVEGEPPSQVGAEGGRLRYVGHGKSGRPGIIPLRGLGAGRGGEAGRDLAAKCPDGKPAGTGRAARWEPGEGSWLPREGFFFFFFPSQV